MFVYIRIVGIYGRLAGRAIRHSDDGIRLQRGGRSSFKFMNIRAILWFIILQLREIDHG